jgi:enamine deaminase RidA (YjgF/YER057c/UK114 family)
MRRLIPSGSRYEAELGYSRAVAQGDWCFVSGCTGADPDTGRLPADVAAQARNAFATVSAALAAADFELGDVVRVQYTLTDRALVPALAPVLAEVFAGIRPAATMVFAALIDPEMLVEIEVTAFRG